MKIQIVYHSDSGNTKKLAQAISEATGVEAQEIKNKPAINGVDLLFVGGSLRAFSLERNCKAFLKSLDAGQAKNVAFFSTSATGKGIMSFAAKILKGKDINLLEEEYKIRSGVVKETGEKHPTEEDCAQAKEFAKKILTQAGA